MIRHVGGRPLRTPALLASYRVGDYPVAGLRSHPWKVTDTQGLLLNAFDFLANRRSRAFVERMGTLGGEVHEHVEFNGPVVLDSGAFNFLKHDNISITPLDVLAAGLKMNADVLVALDHPFPPGSPLEEVKVRLERTRFNTREMFEALALSGEVARLMPVLHGHDAKTLEESLENILSVTGREPEIVGVGSLAPLAKNGGVRKAMEVVMRARRMLPNSHLHVFSMGSALLMLFAFYCGADTVDSQAWVMTAAFKQVQLPGWHQTRLSRREAENDPTRYERKRRGFIEQLLRLRDEGFEVRNWDTGEVWAVGSETEASEYLEYLEDRDGINHLHRRACHNLYAFNFEAGQVRGAVEHGQLEEFIHDRVQNTNANYRRAYEAAVVKKATMQW